jgi:hypothetical protein
VRLRAGDEPLPVIARGLAILSLAALAQGCAASLREQVTPFPPGTPRAVPWTLNRELLTAANRRILIAVELVEGHAPERFALDHLARLASRYGERPASWVVLGSDGAPPLHVDGENVTATGALARDTSYVLVRYVGERLQKWGLSYWRRVAGRSVYVIVINQERHRRWRGFLPERHLEAQTLTHEYGHLIGLPPFDHGYYRDYPDFSDGAHCVNPDCALSKPRLRALVYGFVHIAFGRHYLEDYCAACRAAIAAAKRYWRQRYEV